MWHVSNNNNALRRMIEAPRRAAETDSRKGMAIRLKCAAPYVLLLLLSLVVYLPVMTRATAAKADFGKHITKALALPDSTGHVVHVLYHAIFLSIHELAPSMPYETVALWAILLVMLPVPIMAFALLRKAAGDALPANALIAVSFALTILAPIAVWPSRAMLGYMNPIVYHNPTSITARLFVIPLSLLALRIFQLQIDRSLNHRVYFLLLSACMVLLATLAKPSFTLALLPGCCLLAVWRLLRRQVVDWPLLLFGFCLPGASLMGLFFALAFVSNDSDSAITLGFLRQMQAWIPVWRIPVQLILSLLFPLALYALYFEQARRHLYLNLCWVVFAVAAATAYLFYESGERLAHGNFVWGSYNAIFLLMFASLLFMVEQHARERQLGSGDFNSFGVGVSRNVAIASVCFGLHVLSGIAYYYRFVTQF